MGSPRAAAALHPFEGDGLGRIRPGGQDPRAIGGGRRRGAIEGLRRIRDDIHEDVCRHAFDPALGSFVQAYGSKALDASLLLLPLVGFLPPTDPRIIGTVAAIERRLVVDGFVMRYDTGEVVDGLPPAKELFWPAAFGWPTITSCKGASTRLAPFLSASCRCATMSVSWRKSSTRGWSRQVGNFPQAFSHVALVNTAFNLTRAQGPAEQRADAEGGLIAKRTQPDLTALADLRGGMCQTPRARRRHIANRAAGGGDQPAVADEAVVDARQSTARRLP